MEHIRLRDRASIEYVHIPNFRRMAFSLFNGGNANVAAHEGGLANAARVLHEGGTVLGSNVKPFSA